MPAHEGSIISQGFDLMLYGMGSVFVFLSLMVLVLFVLARLVKKFPGPLPSPSPGIPAESESLSARDIDPAHLKAIELAIEQLYKKG